MTVHNIVSVSGGKDSTATLLVAIALEAEKLAAVFADTGHEHPETYEYVDYLSRVTGVPIRWVRADFSEQIARKRKFIQDKWPQQGVADSVVQDALSVLHPTGNPFLDLCLWKGRFPSTKARFCTDELKRNPIIEQVFFPLLESGGMAVSWQGVRADESLARRHLPECDDVGGGLFNYRPILKWPVEAVFEAHRYMGVKPNPLYMQGCSRVGCMPCINSRKSELREIATRWPEEIARVREWERIVSEASKIGAATFFAVVTDPTTRAEDYISHVTHGIDRMVEWSNTTRGGKQFDLILSDGDGICSSNYGLCE